MFEETPCTGEVFQVIKYYGGKLRCTALFLYTGAPNMTSSWASQGGTWF